MSVMDDTASDLPVKDTDCKPAVIRAIQELSTGSHTHQHHVRTAPKMKEKDLKTRRRVSLISREELEDKFLRLHEDNLLLKDYARKQEDKIKRMSTKLLRLTADLGKTGENKTANVRRDGRDLEAEETIEDLQNHVRDLERRNEALRNRVITFKQRLQFQDGCRHCPYSTVSARIDSGVRRNATLPEKTRRGLRVQSLEKRPPQMCEEALSDEARAEIDRLFQVVENQNYKVDDRSATLLKNMVAMRSRDVGTEMMLSLQRIQQAEEQRTILQENVMHIRLQKELREKNTSLCALKEQFQQLKESYETELEEKQKSLTLSHQAVLTQLEELSTQLKAERAKVLAMEVDQQSVSNLQTSLHEFQERVNDLEKEKELIKEHYENLVKSTMDSDRVNTLQETEKELQKQILQLESQNHSLMIEETQVKDQLLHEREQKEHFKQEVSQLQIQLLEKTNDIIGLQEKVSAILSRDIHRKGEVTSQNVQFNSRKIAIEGLNGHYGNREEFDRLRDTNKSVERWDEEKRRLEYKNNVKPIRNEEETQRESTENRTEQDQHQEKELQRKIHTMDAAHAETILELEKTREMLLLQHKINMDYQEELKTVRLRAESESRDREDMEHNYKDRLLQRDTRIKLLEAQLKDIAYGTFPPRVIHAEPSSPDVDSSHPPALHRGETLFEVHFGGICFSPRGLRDIDDPQPVTFCIYSFYDFETHATPVVSGARPQYNFTSSYAVVPDPDFLRFLRVGTLTVELYQVIGSEHRELARGRLQLEATLQSTEKVHRTTELTDLNIVWEIIGELDYWLHFHGPLSQTQRLQRQRNKAAGYLSTHRQGAAPKSIVSSLADGPQNVLVIRIWSCRRLWGGRIGYQPSPYAVYRFYHHQDHSTCIIPCSNNPQFGDEAFYPVSLTIDLERYLHKEHLYIYVFDDEETKPGSYLGRAEVPLLTLAQGNSIQGDFALLDPVGKCSGSAQVSLEWKFPYKAPGHQVWESVTSCHPLPERLERSHSQKPSQCKVLLRDTSKVQSRRTRPSKSRRVEENLQWDTNAIKRGRRDYQPVTYHKQELIQRSDPLVVNQKDEMTMEVEEMELGDEIRLQEQNEHITDQESNQSEQDTSSLYSNVGKEETGPMDENHFPKEAGDQSIEDSQCTDNDDIIILNPQVPQKTASSKIRVEIASLTLDPYSDVVADETVQRVFVEFRFPGVPLEETETPLSLHKPSRGEEVYFHFSKVIHLDGEEHMERRQFLYMLLRGSDLSRQKHRLQFTVVSDPINEEDEECRDLGYAFLDLQYLLRRSVDPVEETLQIVNVLDQSQVIGALRVAVEARDAVRAVYREQRVKANMSSSSLLIKT
ncbi:fantom isoform X1 [Pelobates cultripes]|uniref:Fantom isoform X1 n=1 Tax=Pelobates cultripes TaxID=61616 RepID=A0AAD1W9K2_PELCU|nr:fantom isoform X1 [Pelobates cultripes]